MEMGSGSCGVEEAVVLEAGEEEDDDEEAKVLKRERD